MVWRIRRLPVIIALAVVLVGCASAGSRACSPEGPVLVEFGEASDSIVVNGVRCTSSLDACITREFERLSSLSRALVFVSETPGSLPVGMGLPASLMTFLNERRIAPVFVSREARRKVKKLGVLEWQSPFENPRDLARTRFLINGRDMGTGQSALREWLQVAKQTSCDSYLAVGMPYTLKGGFSASGETPFNRDYDLQYFEKQGIKTLTPTGEYPPWLQPWRLK